MIRLSLRFSLGFSLDFFVENSLQISSCFLLRSKLVHTANRRDQKTPTKSPHHQKSGSALIIMSLLISGLLATELFRSLQKRVFGRESSVESL